MIISSLKYESAKMPRKKQKKWWIASQLIYGLIKTIIITYLLFMKGQVISKNLRYTFDILYFQYIEVMANLYSELRQIWRKFRAYHHFSQSPEIGWLKPIDLGRKGNNLSLILLFHLTWSGFPFPESILIPNLNVEFLWQEGFKHKQIKDN